ncbi:carbonyl reductase [Usnea florida]
MPQFSRVAAVTGANKGIGLAIVRNLALQYPSSAFNNGPLLVYLCARDKGRGEDAVRTLADDAQLMKAGALAQNGGLTTVKYHGLDIKKTKSIQDFAGFLKKEHPEGIDMVVNNAGIAMNGFDINVVKETLQCNYYGTLTATRNFLPLIRPGGRLVNVSSVVGQLNSKYSEAIRTAFIESKTVNDVTKLMEAFTKAVEQGEEKEQGWPSAAYAVSKSGVTGMTRAIALEVAEGGQTGKGVLVNSCCPGYVSTDMTKHRGAKTVDQGAQTPVFLACGDIGGRAGEFWQRERVSEW